MMLKNFKLEFFNNFFFAQSRRNVISGIAYGVGISFLLVTLVFNYYSPASSLLNDSSFRNTICFSKSSQNLPYISWFLCHPNYTSAATSPTSSFKVLPEESRNVSNLDDTETKFAENRTTYIESGNRSQYDDGKNDSSLLVHEVGDKSLVKEEDDSIAGNQKNISISSTTTDLQLGNYSSTTDEEQECDIFDGQWVLKEEAKEPYYPPGSCPFVDSRHDCSLNKRPDDGYLKWEWQPNGCNIL
ncbi:hypothetical protein MKW94_029432, partial [Papaver nudicaule]|nr:hypothetical protein [Papaver nudicaule]